MSARSAAGNDRPDSCQRAGSRPTFVVSLGPAPACTVASGASSGALPASAAALRCPSLPCFSLPPEPVELPELEVALHPALTREAQPAPARVWWKPQPPPLAPCRRGDLARDGHRARPTGPEAAAVERAREPVVGRQSRLQQHLAQIAPARGHDLSPAEPHDTALTFAQRSLLWFTVCAARAVVDNQPSESSLEVDSSSAREGAPERASQPASTNPRPPCRRVTHAQNVGTVDAGSTRQPERLGSSVKGLTLAAAGSDGRGVNPTTAGGSENQETSP